MDPISDMLTRIRNAQMAGHADVYIPASKMKQAIAQVLAQENFIASVSVGKDPDNEKFERIHVALKYNNDALSTHRKTPMITGILRKSKPGQRLYVKNGMIRKVKEGYGFSVLSTSQGVMSNREARKRGLGGELICEIW